ncbi:hypothetical protein MXM84_06935 [Acinetobacter pittii]|uniref:hypothetical protein n=1 Tax=Acinetobacter calcoaceticus/baumannii complex TaxID=909768 RepID=UPI0004F51D15|nr:MULTISPECIES: hypothetical protein [Acinetobacter calcoaceticus/baumannii complex]MEB6624237.1 hypothetical protein [Acinetobacter pittii]
MGKIIFYASLLLAIVWGGVLIYLNITNETILSLDKDLINSMFGVLAFVANIIICFFCWRYSFQNEKSSEKQMHIGKNAKNVIQVNGNLKIKK